MTATVMVSPAPSQQSRHAAVETNASDEHG
jgi:hypothetical protein